jgi:hypothetical protein
LTDRRLSLDRVDVECAQVVETQHFHLDYPADAVVIERADQVVDAVDTDAIELDDIAR